MKKLSTEEKAKQYDKLALINERVRVRRQLLIAKARQAGIEVSDKEVDEYLKKNK